jgi:polyisoprenoid-binding protein YceI
LASIDPRTNCDTDEQTVYDLRIARRAPMSMSMATSTMPFGQRSPPRQHFSVKHVGDDRYVIEGPLVPIWRWLMLRSMLSLAVAALTSLPIVAADKYTLTGENTKIEFVGTKKEGKHSGGFKKVTGTVTHDSAWGIDVTIDCNSMYSDDTKLTGHLKSGDFFNVKDHPTAKFVSTKIEKTDKGHTVTGKFTLLGKEKEISFPATITAGDTFTLKAEFKINRGDYGMTYGQGKVDDAVAITVDLTAKK